MSTDNTPNDPFSIHAILGRGKRVFVRGVTFHFVGEVTDLDENYLVLRPAIWVAESGRFMDTLLKGGDSINEYEELPDGCAIMLRNVMDIIPWRHEVPRGNK